MRDDPFALLGLPARAGLSDDDVRAAWRRIAAATHPDRDDGGEPGRFGAAAAAYATLRTSFGRGEALADLAGGGRAGGRHRGTRRPGRAGPVTARQPGPERRPGALAVRVAVAAAVAAAVAGLAFAAAGWAPASIGVLVGTLTWLLAVTWRCLPDAGRWRRGGRGR